VVQDIAVVAVVVADLEVAAVAEMALDGAGAGVLEVDQELSVSFGQDVHEVSLQHVWHLHKISK